MKQVFPLSILIICGYSFSLTAQLTPATAISEMGRGINLGNTLEPPLEGSWNNGPAQEAHFDAYVAAGFSNVRIPVRWDQHTSQTTPFAVDTTWMNRVEQVVDWGLARGFYITLNGHHEDWLKNGYANPTLRARYDSIWVQIAKRFQHKSDKLLFEIINEPKGMTVAQVDELNQRILDIIRKTNPTRIVIFGGNEWANSEQLLSAAIPSDDYVIGYYHAYDPWSFSGQGMGTWGTANDYQQLTNKYTAVKNWSTTHGIPVHHSEFGAVLSCDFNSRMRIYAHNVEQCIKNGFAFSVWDDGGDFGILNRTHHTWPAVKEILIHYHEDSPNQIFSTIVPDSNGSPTIQVTWNNRAQGNGNIVIERSLGASSSFAPLDTLPPSATSYTDQDIITGKTYTYRMYTKRQDGTLLHGYPTRLRVPATIQTPFTGSPILIPGILEVEAYDNGGEGLAYHDNEATNIPGGYRLDEGVDIGASGNKYLLEYVASGEWIEYTVEVAQTGVYSIEAEVASEVANGAFSIRFDKNNASSRFTTPNTGNWYAFQRITADDQIVLEAGQQQMRISIDNNIPFNVDNLTFKLETVSDTEIEASKASFSVAPNPSHGVIRVEMANSYLKQQVHLEVYNSGGQLVNTFLVADTTTFLDLSTLSSGIYQIRLVGHDTNLARRIIIQ